MITEAGESNSNEYSVLHQKFANDSGVFPGEGCFVFAWFLFVFVCFLFFVILFFFRGWGSVLLLFSYPSWPFALKWFRRYVIYCSHGPFVFLDPKKDFKLIWLSNLLTLSVPNVGFQKWDVHTKTDSYACLFWYAGLVRRVWGYKRGNQNP